MQIITPDWQNFIQKVTFSVAAWDSCGCFLMELSHFSQLEQHPKWNPPKKSLHELVWVSLMIVLSKMLIGADPNIPISLLLGMIILGKNSSQSCYCSFVKFDCDSKITHSLLIHIAKQIKICVCNAFAMSLCFKVKLSSTNPSTRTCTEDLFSLSTKLCNLNTVMRFEVRIDLKNIPRHSDELACWWDDLIWWYGDDLQLLISSYIQVWSMLPYFLILMIHL